LKVTIAIPTVLRKTLESTLRCISKQSYTEFEVLLIYKGVMRESVKQYEKLMKVNFIEQKDGLLEEAYNLALKLSDSDILLFTDDDACPGRSWVEDHVNLHKKNPEIGVAGGLITGKYWKNYPNAVFEIFKGTPMMEEADPVFRDYTGYLTKTGLSVDRQEHKNSEKTLAVAGVNMSVKRAAYENFQVYTYSLFASYIETQISLNAIRRGYSSARFPGALTYHKKIHSLSVPGKRNEWKLIVEKFAFPYIANRFYKVDLDLLQQLTLKVEGFPHDGLSLALEGIENNYDPLQFRKMLSRRFETESR